MTFKFKPTVFAIAVSFFVFFTTNVLAQTACCDEKKDKAACNTEKVAEESTSGCLPSSCRGAKTKFGEAKVISSLRENLIGLKAQMEQSKTPTFAQRSYDIHGIVGENEEKSLQIIVRELKLIEKEFASKTKFKTSTFKLPSNKAKQVAYLDNRIKELKAYL